MYTMAANIAMSRPPWEAANLVKEELSVVICNRSAAYSAAGDFLSALVDAEVVLVHKRNWSKGHFRKAKALVGLGRLEDARDAIALGLQFEPNNAVRLFRSLARALLIVCTRR
jgi:translocation protein SEC72